MFTLAIATLIVALIVAFAKRHLANRKRFAEILAKQESGEISNPLPVSRLRTNVFNVRKQQSTGAVGFRSTGIATISRSVTAKRSMPEWKTPARVATSIAVGSETISISKTERKPGELRLPFSFSAKQTCHSSYPAA